MPAHQTSTNCSDPSALAAWSTKIKEPTILASEELSMYAGLSAEGGWSIGRHSRCPPGFIPLRAKLRFKPSSLTSAELTMQNLFLETDSCRNPSCLCLSSRDPPYFPFELALWVYTRSPVVLRVVVQTVLCRLFAYALVGVELAWTCIQCAIRAGSEAAGMSACSLIVKCDWTADRPMVRKAKRVPTNVSAYFVAHSDPALTRLRASEGTKADAYSVSSIRAQSLLYLSPQ
ncbi:uncharacterized protein BT62DRAFT_1075182 [Guyanagaster necrorhizus]|uniref:Uncharacterized protein n=1 Tax=Guyanagaster necrorhizus TaxID=856835 RepID=A0A9P7VXY3_9AGAR|nr:uncharacterized protein BT62DRAFT_1075182 [Guyanagaster necrorhizus MCA 3950]KAG7447866.1 hypothetical protein BT62DRAFT_1075182 [Guyanagaster necrorhizus MCA 3950]